MDIPGADPIIAAAGAPVCIPPWATPASWTKRGVIMTTVRILTAAIMCSALALSACQKKAETPPAADAAAPAAATAATDPNAANVPAECNAYLDHVAACSAKLAQANPMAAEQMRKSAEQTRASWAAIDNQTALAAACKQVDDGFAASATAMGC